MTGSSEHKRANVDEQSSDHISLVELDVRLGEILTEMDEALAETEEHIMAADALLDIAAHPFRRLN